MKSKTNKRIKRVKKTLRTRRKLKKMRGGVFDALKERFKTYKENQKKYYCEECARKCNNAETLKPPSNPQLPKQSTVNGWNTAEENHYQNGSSTMLSHKDLVDDEGNKCSGVSTYNSARVSGYLESIDKLPTPGEYQTINGITNPVLLICYNGQLWWVDKDNKNNKYNFNIDNPLSIIIDGVENGLKQL
jgi:hypothetical protein